MTLKIEKFTQCTGLNLDQLDLNVDLDPIEFFKLFVPDSLINLISETKNVFFARNNDFFIFFSNISYKKYESCYIWFESVSNSLSK